MHLYRVLFGSFRDLCRVSHPGLRQFLRTAQTPYQWGFYQSRCTDFFEFKGETGTVQADILKIDARFVSLLKWLGENHITVRLSGADRDEGYAVYKIREIAFGGGSKLSAEDGFLQFMIERLLSSDAPPEEIPEEEEEETGDSMKLTSIQSITDFITCAGRTLPDNIRLWREGIWRLPAPTRYLRRNAAMPRGRFPL